MTRSYAAASPARRFVRTFLHDPGARLGLAGIAVLLIPALYAPFIANGRPLLMWRSGKWSLPFLTAFFAPGSTEYLIEQLFNYTALLLPAAALLAALFRRRPVWRLAAVVTAAVLLALPFAGAKARLDKTDYRLLAAEPGVMAVFAPIPYGPFETVALPYAPPDPEHLLGADDIGRDLASRLIYGARASLAVGIFATALALLIGTGVGLAAGFYRGWFDLAVMRCVEVLLCFPTFLLLLILMSIMGDRKFEQSILLVIAVLGLTGWIGLAFLVRGEVLKQRALPYVDSCITGGIPAMRIMWRHLLPNITGPILISFTFGIAGAILAESSLSFLGFGVQPPTASWGGLLRQAFDNPLDHWHLTGFPGLALFVAVLSFNFTGEALRRALAVR